MCQNSESSTLTLCSPQVKPTTSLLQLAVEVLTPITPTGIRLQHCLHFTPHICVFLLPYVNSLCYCTFPSVLRLNTTTWRAQPQRPSRSWAAHRLSPPQKRRPGKDKNVRGRKNWRRIRRSHDTDIECPLGSLNRRVEILWSRSW